MYIVDGLLRCNAILIILTDFKMHSDFKQYFAGEKTESDALESTLTSYYVNCCFHTFISFDLKDVDSVLETDGAACGR